MALPACQTVLKFLGYDLVKMKLDLCAQYGFSVESLLNEQDAKSDHIQLSKPSSHIIATLSAKIGRPIGGEVDLINSTNL